MKHGFCPGQFFDSGFFLLPRFGRWRSTPAWAVPRWDTGTVVLAEKLYLIGGDWGGQETRVDIYDPEIDSWSRGPDLPITLCEADASTLIIRDRIIVIGGQIQENGKAGPAIWALSKDRWETAGQLSEPRILPVAGIIDGKLYVAGASFDGDHPLPEMWSCDAP